MPDYTPINDLIEMIGADVPMQLVGSTAINGQGTDIDIAVNYVISPDNEAADRQDATDLIRRLRNAGCEVSGGANYEAINLEADDRFVSLRRGNFNLLLCFNDRSWNRFIKGRDFCILLRDLGVDMSSKAVRVAIHGMANHGNIDLVRADLARLPQRVVRADTPFNRAEGLAALRDMPFPRGQWGVGDVPVTTIPAMTMQDMQAALRGGTAQLVIADDLDTRGGVVHNHPGWDAVSPLNFIRIQND